jgi:septal ring factor EnvC (AmiA/AmiB activator)
MDAAVVFQILATGLGLVGVVSAAAVVSRSAVMQQNSAQLRNAYNDARANLSDQEKKNARLEGELARLSDHITTLEELVTGRADVAALADEVRTLTGVIRSDYGRLAALAQLLVQERTARGQHPPPPDAPGYPPAE